MIGRFPGQESRLSLVWAVPELQINNARNGVKLSDIDRQRLNRHHHQPSDPASDPEEVTAAQTHPKANQAAAKLPQHWDATPTRLGFRFARRASATR